MSAEKFNIVELLWEKVLDARPKDGEWEKSVPETGGLYQIYANSSIYGENALIFIGQADSLRKDLKKQVFENVGIYRQEITTLRFAEFDKTVDGITRDIVESILIAWHKPSFNTKNIFTAKCGKEYVLVQNHEDKGCLDLWCSNYYWFQ